MWLKDYYTAELRHTCENFIQHSSLVHQIDDSDMQHQLHLAMLDEVNRMWEIARRMRQKQTTNAD